jgi:hypothetical protein
VRALIAELLDDTGDPQPVRSAFSNERAAQLDMAEYFGRLAPSLRPMFQLDAVRMAKANRAVIAAAGQPDWWAAKATLRNDPVLKSIGPPQSGLAVVFGRAARGGAAGTHPPVDYTTVLTTDVCNLQAAGNWRAIETDFRLRAERRLAAASLAVQLYRADHAGAFPPSLEALVPKYLPELPRDPMSGQNKPIGYVIARGALPDGGDRPLVYGAGTDGGNDTTTRGLGGLPKVPLFGLQKGLSDDWRDVSRWTPPKTKLEEEEDAKLDAEAAESTPAGS